MARFLRKLSSATAAGPYEPAARTFHRTVLVGDKLFVWGGLQDSLPEVHHSADKQEFLSDVDVFELRTGLWEWSTTIGNTPLGVAAYSCAAVGELAYYFGGLCGHGENCLHNSLFALDTSRLKWSEIVPTSERVEAGPMRKAWCGMVAFKTEDGEDMLFVVGGHGIFPDVRQPGAHYVPDDKDDDDDSDDELESGIVKGRTNEHHMVSLPAAAAAAGAAAVWSSPTVSGSCPPPCSAFSFTAVDSKRVVMYGGTTRSCCEANSDVYIATLTKTSVDWSRINRSPSMTWPVGRGYHAADTVPGPGLMVVGGEGSGDQTLGDAWILDLNDGIWEQLAVCDIGCTRMCHSLTCFPLGESCVMAVLYGGGPADTFITATPVVVELVQETDQRWLTSSEFTQPNLAGNAEYLLKVTSRILQREEFNHKRALEAAETMKQHLSKEQAKVKETRQLHEENRLLQSRLHIATEEIEQLRILSSSSRHAWGGHDQLHWIVERAEIVVTDEVLGQGAWGEVRVAEFRGLRVAAKFIHEVILSDYNRSQFHREMSIASRVRHPNLVQFIGAVVEGNPILLSELMPISLTKQLMKGRLTCRQVLSIAIDTALALNYLHQLKPDHIIHRDLSSSNILLEHTGLDTWRAKVSDFGSANFASLIQKSENPGNPVYSAPEAHCPAQHSPRMDSYSLSIVLTEMCCHQAPALTPTETKQRAAGIPWPAMSSLIQQCLCVQVVDRLEMHQILHCLRNMKEQQLTEPPYWK